MLPRSRRRRRAVQLSSFLYLRNTERGAVRRNFFRLASSWITGAASCPASKWTAVCSASKRSRCEYMTRYSCAWGGLGWANSASVSGIRRPASQHIVPWTITRNVSSAKRRAGRGLDPVRQLDHRVPSLDPQLRADVVQEHREPSQDALQRALARSSLCSTDAAQQGEAAALHAAPVEPEELVVELARDGQPQRRRTTRRARGRGTPRAAPPGCRPIPAPARARRRTGRRPRRRRSASRRCPSPALFKGAPILLRPRPDWQKAPATPTAPGIAGARRRRIQSRDPGGRRSRDAAQRSRPRVE